MTLASRTAPLRRLPLEVGPGERPGAVLASRGEMVAALHEGGLLERDDRSDAARLTSLVDEPGVISPVERGGCRDDPASGERGKRRLDGKGLVLAGRLYFPRERQARQGAHSGMEAEAVVPVVPVDLLVAPETTLALAIAASVPAGRNGCTVTLLLSPSPEHSRAKNEVRLELVDQIVYRVLEVVPCTSKPQVISGSLVSSHSRQIHSPTRSSRALSEAGTIVTPQIGQIGGRSSSTSEVWVVSEGPGVARVARASVRECHPSVT